MERPDISSYTVNDFDDWRQAGTLELTPKFQRREVWKTPARSYFIDSILRGIPIPPILIRLGQSQDNRKVVREIIDGQQRLRAVLDFIDNKYALAKSVGGPNARKRFSQLAGDDRTAILQYGFRCDVFKTLSDVEVLDVFARVNTYSVGLNNQELRNGKFFGQFKQFVYKLAHEHVEFWRRYRIFSENSIARMLEVELTSELIVAELDGQQDKKNSLDDFYGEFDEEFPGRQKAERNFKATIDWITDSVGDDLASSEFHRAPLFYTLFAVAYHRLFGLPKESAASPKSGKLSVADQRSLTDAVGKLSEVLSLAKETKKPPKKDSVFVEACQRQTDNIKPRQVRFARLYREAFRRR
jgi:hypothetical protein